MLASVNVKNSEKSPRVDPHNGQSVRKKNPAFGRDFLFYSSIFFCYPCPYMSQNLAKNTAFMTMASVGQKLVAFVYFLFLARVMMPEKTGIFFLASIVMIAASLALLCYGILRASKNLRYEALGMFVSQLITVLVGGISLIIQPDVRFLILALIFGSVSTLVISAWQVVSLYGWRLLLPSWDKEAQWSMIKIMIPFALAGIFTKIYSTLDVVLISKLMSTTAVGIYSVAYKFTYAFQFLPLAFAAALYPSLSSTIEHNKQATAQTFSRAVWYIP